MYLTQILLPLYDGRGRRITRAAFTEVKETLTQRFGGVTAHTQAPAEGAWRIRGKTDRDDIITFEVMSKRADAKWWRTYKESLEARFHQEWIVVRSIRCTLR